MRKFNVDVVLHILVQDFQSKKGKKMIFW
jgi:hypothetical protein